MIEHECAAQLNISHSTTLPSHPPPSTTNTNSKTSITHSNIQKKAHAPRIAHLKFTSAHLCHAAWLVGSRRVAALKHASTSTFAVWSSSVPRSVSSDVHVPSFRQQRALSSLRGADSVAALRSGCRNNSCRRHRDSTGEPAAYRCFRHAKRI
jgi:hypothetical protein